MERSSALDLFCDYLVTERRASTQTISAYCSDIRHYFQHTSVTAWSSEHAINVYLMELGAESSTVWRRRSALVQLCKFLHDEELIPSFNPQKIYKPRLPQKLPKALTKVQVTAVLQHFAADPSALGVKKYAFVTVMYATASRVSECAQIKLADIHNDKILVTGKRGKSRWVFLNDSAQGVLRQYMEVRPQWAQDNNRGYRLIELLN